MSCDTFNDITVAVSKAWSDLIQVSNADSSGNIISSVDLTTKTVTASVISSTGTIQLSIGSGITITNAVQGMFSITLAIPQLATLTIPDKVVIQYTIWNSDGTEFAPINATYVVRAG